MTPKRVLPLTIKSELNQRSVSGSFPVLLDFIHEDIRWNGVSNFEDGHIRLINGSTPVWYQGTESERKYFMPCYFDIKLPEENGKTVGDISVTVGFTDQSFIKVIRSVTDKIRCKVIAAYQKDNEGVYSFLPLRNYSFEVGNVSWNQNQATWKLVRDSIQSLNVPRDNADNIRFPGIVEDK